MQHRRAILTAVFTATFVAAPFVTPPFTGFRPDQLPIPQIDPPVQPAGWAFAIWGVIYSLLVVSALFGLARRPADDHWNLAREPLLVCLGLGSFWLWLAGISAIGATILILVMAPLAIAAAATAARSQTGRSGDRWLLQLPAAMLAGWLTAASFVSLGATAAGYGLMTDAHGWAAICILAVVAIGATVQRSMPAAPEYGLTLGWALTGIIGANLGRNPAIVALAGIGILVVGAVIWLVRPGRSRA